MKILTNKEIELIKDTAVAEHMEKLMDDEKQVLEKIAARTECLFAFDFANPDINVFSIERNGWNTSDETTIIGYILSGDIHDVKQWYFCCSREQHNELVKKWVEYKSVKPNTSKKILKG
jgi:hypothetical protein